jgi:hypothetical protein
MQISPLFLRCMFETSLVVQTNYAERCSEIHTFSLCIICSLIIEQKENFILNNVYYDNDSKLFVYLGSFPLDVLCLWPWTYIQMFLFQRKRTKPHSSLLIKKLNVQSAIYPRAAQVSDQISSFKKKFVDQVSRFIKRITRAI